MKYVISRALYVVPEYLIIFTLVAGTSSYVVKSYGDSFKQKIESYNSSYHARLNV